MVRQTLLLYALWLFVYLIESIPEHRQLDVTFRKQIFDKQIKKEGW